jgi:transcriptional regulator with XRE-family HTH domain
LKDLHVERGLTLEQLAEETNLSKSALGSYEGDKQTVDEAASPDSDLEQASLAFICKRHKLNHKKLS